MGFTPAQAGAMSLWQFMACWDGWCAANTVEKTEAPSDDAFEAMKREHGLA